MTLRIVRIVVLLVLLSSCGDGTVILTFNTGTVASDPECRGRDGQFDFRNQQGLLLIVIINSNTLIFLSNGLPGRCSDIIAGDMLRVRGVNDAGQVTAQEVRVQ
jgi:hypothetical protein